MSSNNLFTVKITLMNFTGYFCIAMLPRQLCSGVIQYMQFPFKINLDKLTVKRKIVMLAAVSHFQINYAVTSLSCSAGVPKFFSVSIFCPFL